MRILLVDDDSGVLQGLMGILKTIPGHEFRCAATAQKAVEHAATLGGCDLLITDVVMEPTDGFTLRNELQAQFPGMKTVFISGYDLSDHAEQTSGAHVLGKPVDADRLRELINAAETELLAPIAQPQPAAVQATPTAVPVARPVAHAPAPGAVPRAAQPVARPTAAPAARPVARPVAAPSARPVAAPIATAQPPPPPVVNDPLIGVQLGDYRVQQLIGRGVWGSVYLAIQLSVNRPVGLKVLDPAHAEDEDARTRFLADARAKAAVQHPFIVSVFEADERNNLVFYTHEYQEGATLEDMITRGQLIDEKTALHVMKVAAEGLNYLWSQNLSHGLIDASGLRIGTDGIPRLANLATSTPAAGLVPQAEIMALSAMIQRLVPANAMSPGLRALLGRMGGGANPITSWPPVITAVKALEPKVIPVEAAKIKAADAAAMRAVVAARKAQKRAFYTSIGTLVLLAGAVAWLAYYFLASNMRSLDAKVTIPAGSYIVGPPTGGTRIDLGSFDIDKYEVTIGEYAKFIDFITANPDKSRNYDHPAAPRHIQHDTTEVLMLIANAKIRGGTVFRQDAGKGRLEDPGADVDLNCPMVMVTWWDAYAYAKWKNRDLPTEEEWEAAARGTAGFKYPWGADLKLNKFNSNEGYKPLAPGATKTPDGFNYWSPVDEFSGDESPLGVIGMAGNVSEWVYRKEQSKEIPVLKGGSFAGPPVAMFDRVLTLPAEDCWFVWPEAQKPASKDPHRPGVSGRLHVGDRVTPDVRTLYIGFRTVFRK